MKTLTVCFAGIALSAWIYAAITPARADMPPEAPAALIEFNGGGFAIPGKRVMEKHKPFTACQIKDVWKGTAKPLSYFEQVLGGPGTRLNSGTWNSGTDIIDIYVWLDAQTNLIALKFNRGMMAEARTDKDYGECLP